MLYYLAVFVKDYSWMNNVKNSSSLKDVKIYQIIDRHNIKGDFANKYQDYKPVYLHFMLDWIWKTAPIRFGISKLEPQKAFTQKELLLAIENTTIPYALSEVDVNSKQAIITIKNNDTRPFYINSLKYIKARFFSKKESELKSVLEKFTDIEIEILD